MAIYPESKGGGGLRPPPTFYAYNDVESLGRLYLELFVRLPGGFLMEHYAPTPRTMGGPRAYALTHARTYAAGFS